MVRISKQVAVTLFSATTLFSWFSVVSQAETLKQALASSFVGNPGLRAARAGQRATDELVPQALSGWRPTVNLQGTYGEQWQDTNVSRKTETTPGTLNITLNQPVFRGFKTIEGTRVAEANVRSGRQQLRGTEETTLINAIAAYLNVIRDRQILALRKRNIGLLQEQLRATTARFDAGELTRTDVAQARSTVEGARGQAASAQAQLVASEANYLQVIGHSPGKLAMPGMAPIPRSLDEAMNIAQATNPNILSAAQLQIAAEHQVEVNRGDLLPQASIQASQTWTSEPSSQVKRSRTTVIEGVLSVPIYEAGRTYSLVRQAKETASQYRIRVITAVRSTRENVSVAWGNVAAAAAGVQANTAQVSSAQLALSGIKQEYAVGSRSTIDVLNSQQTLLGAQISLVTAQHDRVLASYQVLQATGQLTADHLGLGVSYNPRAHYDAVRNKWIGFGPDPVE